MTYEQAMADIDHIDEWKKVMQIEISALESLGSWDEVDISDAKSRIIPGTWVFRVKRTPDGDIKKRKARFCCRGDMQKDDFETFAPVVSWTCIRNGTIPRLHMFECVVRICRATCHHFYMWQSAFFLGLLQKNASFHLTTHILSTHF
jgi:hypothetical protein